MKHNKAVEIARSGEGAIVMFLCKLSEEIDEKNAHISRLQDSVCELSDKLETSTSDYGYRMQNEVR